MLHPAIRLEGSILSADILDAIERSERVHQPIHHEYHKRSEDR